MIPLVGFLLLHKFLVLGAVFLALAFLLRGRTVLQKLCVYSFIMLLAVLALLKTS